MLIVSRKQYQTINIGRDMKVIILEIRGSQVRLGIQAPKDLKITREDVFSAQTSSYSYFMEITR